MIVSSRPADIFTVNQHNAANCPGTGPSPCPCGSTRPLPPPEWWSGAFKTAIASFGHVVAVLDPWDAPVPLTRAWCLWELLCAVESNTKLEVTLSPAQAVAFAQEAPWPDAERAYTDVQTLGAGTWR